MVRVLVVDDKQDARPPQKRLRDLYVVHVIRDSESHGTEPEGPNRDWYLFIEIPGVEPWDLIGDTGGVLPSDATWSDLASPLWIDEILFDELGNPHVSPRCVGMRRCKFRSSIPSLQQVRNSGGGTYTPEQARTFLESLAA